MAEQQKLWVENWRPKTIDDCILPEQTKSIFKGFLSSQVPNLLLYGKPGTGKTSLAKALIKELNAESLFIDASSENGKSMLEELVVPFVSTVSIQNPNVPKIVLLDECIEENETVRIGTLNNYKDIPIKELEPNKMYNIISFNLETKKLEDDTGYLCTDKFADLYKVTLSNNTSILCNENHPFIIEDMFGNLYKRRVKEGLLYYTTYSLHKKLTITNVEKLNKVGRVMDIHVTKNHTFITSNNLITSNCDGLTTQAQKSFRPVIELYNKSARFFFTCNFPEKILDPIKSRCSCFNFNIDKKNKNDIIKQFFFRCTKILDTYEIKYDKKTLFSFIIKMFPDFRRTINELQSYSSGYKVIDEGILTSYLHEDLGTELYTLLKTKNYDKCRQFLAENVYSPEDIFSALYNQIHTNVPKEIQPQIIVTLAQYQMWSSQVMNQNINLLACFIEIMSAL